MNSWRHAVSSAHKWGGDPQDYILVHEFLDSSKKSFGDVRHRALYHHTQGVWLAQEIFGRVLNISKGAGKISEVPVREVAERHILEDLGWIPSPQDYLQEMSVNVWMSGKRAKEENFEILKISSQALT